jgi:hypothetical protein
LEFVVCTPLFGALIAFSTACIISGLFFAGVDAAPPEKVFPTVGSIQRWVGLVVLICAVVFFLGSPLGTTISVWSGALLADFFLMWWALADLNKTGNDAKPIAWLCLLPGAVGLVLFGVTSQMMVVVPGFEGFFRDLAILLYVAAVACLMFFIGIRWAKGSPTRVGAWLFVVTGAIVGT